MSLAAPTGAIPGESRIEPTAQVGIRPWGHFELLTHNTRSTVKVITVLPGQRLSLQRHNSRDEWWQIIDAGLHVEVNGVQQQPVEGQRVWIPRLATHRVSNPGLRPCRLLEIAFGHFSENDIERIEDDYARI